MPSVRLEWFTNTGPGCMNRVRLLAINETLSEMDEVIGALRLEGLKPELSYLPREQDLAERLRIGLWDVILAILVPGEHHATAAALEVVRQFDPNLPFIVITRAEHEQHAIDLMRRGANDYLLSGQVGRIGVVVRREMAIRHDRLALQASRPEFVSHMLASVRDAVVATDLNGIVTYWNHGATRLFGWSAEEILGRPYADRFPEPMRSEVLQEMRKRATGDDWDGEYEDLRKDGSRVWIDCRVRRLCDDAGRPIGIIGVSHDISARKRAEAANRELAGKYANLFDRAVVGIFQSTPSGKYLTVNPGFAHIFGYDSVDDLQTSITDIGRQLYAEPEQRLEYIRRMIEHDEMLGFECEGVTKDGTRIWVRLDSRAVRDESGEVKYFEGFAQDITARKRAELALQQSQALLSTIVEGTPECIKVVSPSGHLIMMNSAGLSMIEANTIESVRGACVFDLIDDADRLRFIELHQRVCEGERGRLEYDIVGLRGGKRTVETHAVPIQFNGVIAHMAVTRDVTARRQAERALRDSEERLQLALRAGRMGTFDWDVPTNRVVWSDTHYELFGYPPGDRFPVEFHHFADRIHPEDLPGVLAELKRAMETATDYTNEARVVLPSGTVRWIMGKGQYTYDDDGKPTRMLGAIVDITEQKAAEKALRSSEERFRAFMDNGPFLAWIADLDGKVEYASEPFSIALAVPEGPVEGRNLRELFPREMAEQYIRNNLEVYSTKQVMATNEPSVRADGSTGTFLVYKFPIPSVDHALIGGVGIDITEQSRLQSELLMRDRAIQAVRQGILITDCTVPGNPIVYASPGLEQMSGYAAAEVCGRDLYFLLGKETDSAEQARLHDAIGASTACTVELLSYRRDGESFWCEISVTPVRDDAGKVIHFVGILTEVTARRHLEDQLRQAQKMEAIGQLAGGVAHDFNNLLTVINGFSDMALGEVPIRHPLREPIVAIREAGERAAALTQQLLAFSRKAIVAPRALELNDVVGSITKLLRRLIGEDITLTTVLSSTSSRIRIDPGQLEQVIMNLSINARDAMPKGGRLTLRTGITELTTRFQDCEPGRYAQLQVTDTGSGMTEEVKARIFEPFFTTKGLGKGTGLGLAMVYGIVKQAGGNVQVESAVGHGTTFTVLLPLIEPEAPEQPSGENARWSPRGTETILLAEDEEGVRHLAKISLELQGYQVLVAHSGTEAQAISRNFAGPIHMLLTDVVMPDLSGRELAEIVRSARPEVRVLYVSGYTDDALIRHGIAVAEAFLQKPFTPMTLARKVREVLDYSRNPTLPSSVR